MLESLVFSRAKIFSLVSLLFLASIARAIPAHLLFLNILVYSILAKVIAFQASKNIIGTYLIVFTGAC